MDEVIMNFDYPKDHPAIIKVVGVGGGGGNAVTHMYREGIRDVAFVLCNTDNQALLKSEVPIKVQLGKKTTQGLGAGNKPQKAKEAAEESIDDLRKMLDDETKMVFITAGMGGGTGTGAAPIVAGVAKEMGILTIGIVTIPFMFEGERKILQALTGVEEISRNVDALLVINNERLREIYSDLTMLNAFQKADDTLTVAAKSIAEIITIPGHINLDFADVETVLKDGGVAIMSSGLGKGSNRVTAAIDSALNSPLLNNNDVFKAKKILLNVSFNENYELMVEEMDEIHDFMAKFGKDIEVIWGAAVDNNLEEYTKVTVLATGFGIEDIPLMTNKLESDRELSEIEKNRIAVAKEQEEINKALLIKKYYGPQGLRDIGRTTRPKPFIFTAGQMDDNDIIDAVISHPAYNRNPKVIFEVIEKKEASHATPPSEKEKEEETTDEETDNVIQFNIT
jgi:cell division protein FtsZ